MNSKALAIAGMALLACADLAGCGTPPSDLNPVTFKTPPTHPPVVLVTDGKARAKIAVMRPKTEIDPTLNGAIKDLQHFIQASTGAELPIAYGKVDGPAIVIGDCELAGASGLRGAEMPVEGFAIKTAADTVFIVGRDGTIAPRTESHGTAWGVYEFLERFVGVRFYFPGEIGCSVPRGKDLAVGPVWVTDAPSRTPSNPARACRGTATSPATACATRRIGSTSA